ncbi:HEPN domain-containing protein [Oscillospiraceae bacterium OttesenSCG-928-F05]|nr:HEPN domain-containing protein [Oscillospiraceae bacterium OttesenSCG-928-F05]
MTREEHIAYWVKTSEQDYVPMKHLFESGDYMWSLFIGHLVVEKLLKAVFVRNSTDALTPPKSHDLLLLAGKSGLELDERKKKLLADITTYNIETRYPSYKQSFSERCTKEYCAERLREIEEVREWLREMLK